MDNNHTKKSKKVLWVHNFPKKEAGGGIWMYNQLKYLDQEVDTYLLDNLRNPFRFIRHLINLRKLSRQYEVAHAQYGSAVGFLTSMMACTRVLSLKGSDWYRAPNPSVIQKIRIYLGSLLTRVSIPRFNKVIVMSDAMKREVQTRYPGLEVITLVDPIDMARFQPKPRDSGRKDIRILFASVDKNNPVKRFNLAQESVARLQRRIPEARLIVMTRVPHDEVCDFMNDTDVLLLTSTHEGWPNVVKEMLACNKPFVSTRVSDLPEIAQKTRNCFATEGTAEALSEGLYKAITADPENLRSLVEPFDIRNYVSTLKHLYHQLQNP